MNKTIIESIEWHKEHLFKLLESDDFYKIEGDIHSAKTELNEIIEKAKSKKKVWVKPTASKKGFYREQEVGSGDDSKIYSGEKKYDRVPEVAERRARLAEVQERDRMKKKLGLSTEAFAEAERYFEQEMKSKKFNRPGEIKITSRDYLKR